MYNKHLFFLILFLALPFQAFSKTTYILGVDGLSYESFKQAQAQGLFQEFQNVSAHISPFPSMTDLSWSMITKTPKIFGRAGRISSVEAVYFDESSKSTAGDVRDYYRRLAQPKYYMGAFEYIFNPYVEGLMYFPTQELPKLEIKTVLDDMKNADSSEVITGYVGAIDSTAHTQLNRLYPVLESLNELIEQFLKSKSKEDIELILISDHGNVGDFKEGIPEKELKNIEIGPVLKEAGLNFVQTLKQENDMTMPLLALGSWAPVYLKNTENSARLLSTLKKYDWFDFAIKLIRKTADQIQVEVNGQNGRAIISHNLKNQTYSYRPVEGNPLLIPINLHSKETIEKSLTIQEIEFNTRQGLYPDSLIRLIQSTNGEYFDFPDLILTFKDGYYLNNSFGKMTKMYRTHGSLSRRASLGIVASTHRKFSEYLRSDEILQQIGVTPQKIFTPQKISDKNNDESFLGHLFKPKINTKEIPTGSQNFSQKRIFQQMTKVVSNSRPFFVATEIKDFLKTFEVFSNSQGQAQDLKITGFNLENAEVKNFLSPEEIGKMTDLIIKTPDLNSIQNSSEFLALKQKFFPSQNQHQNRTNNQIDTKIVNANSNDPNQQSENNNSLISEDEILSKKNQAIAIKRSAMKVYQIPYWLDQSLVIQEKPFIQETRDLEFIKYWKKNNDFFISNKGRMDTQTTIGWIPWRKNTESVPLSERLFQEVFKEKIIEDRISPEPLELLYNAEIKNTTFVYVPGTYNAIFDKEIFSLALMSLKEDLGLRVLTAPIYSACSSDFNGEVLLNFLKEDQKKFISRNEEPPKYILIGYSKGGVDSLYFLLKDKTFAKQYITGLVALASPLHGSNILEKAEIPFSILSLLIDEDVPEVCKNEKTIRSTGSSQSMLQFWRNHENELIGLTRYFSLSFVSNPEDSHLFMKVTKALGQFNEDNDGIVGVSSTLFPKRLSATDLGKVQGDHLSGILSSRFPQKAFFRAIATTLAEMKIEDSHVNEEWNTRSIIDAAPVLINENLSVSINPKLKEVYFQQVKKDGSYSMKRVKSYKDSYDLNSLILGLIKDPLSNYKPTNFLPANQLNFDVFSSLDLTQLPQLLSSRHVQLFGSAQPNQIHDSHSAKANPNEIDLSAKQSSALFYRMDNQFNYESRSPVGGDDNPKWGLQMVPGPDNSGWLSLKSDHNSIRLTTLAYRFRPIDFSEMNLSLIVNQEPMGADPVKGKSGKDDSAFQIWFTLRDLKGVSDRTLVSNNGGSEKIYYFGYYWGSAVPGENRKAGDLFENYYSNKNVVVTTLPVSYQILLNSNSKDLGKNVNYQKNLSQDIARAYPEVDINNFEVIAITIQMDSNDTNTKSEALMKTLKFTRK